MATARSAKEWNSASFRYPPGARFFIEAEATGHELVQNTRICELLKQPTRGKTMSDVAERVKKIVVEHLGVEAEKVTENASFIDDLGADSLDTVELVMAFEEEFGCEIPDDAAEHILTVGDAVKFLEKNASAA